MTLIGYHASHEQFSPSELIGYVQAAEAAGFDAVMSSDHLTPWSERQGQSGFAWAWLGAALQATRAIPFGIITIPMGWRYHPAITAQAGATIAEMFSERLPWIAVGSGQAMNEHVIGERWPSKSERNERLLAAVEIIRDLWSGKLVSRAGPIKVDQARIHTLPDEIPRIVAGALSPETAEWAGGWADALITINQPPDKLRKIVDAFRRGGGEEKPLYLQTHVSYAGSDEDARANAFEQWRSNAISAAISETLRLPEEFDEACLKVRPEDLDEHVRISADPQQHVEWLEADVAMGFEEIYIHNVGRNQCEFIEVYGREVLPVFRAGATAAASDPSIRVNLKGRPGTS
ncbi:TIGR03885 family FMN-dependent LLM class oxidoreductase [Rhizobium lentis]|uniref:TIGR03885 family FMN-dependent LLM class oxidoreductase n=1 Tax=Rhizobium lentis TaxID=1138194 RepID=A0A9Q3MIM5_9HYPH|nr:TIGR03885 family FMN-dependent LLM class oxidoreductase [Rhizobium lentis]MBX4959275.1 TIGR03885 family FMN-dependent LLM class oxidoreductase [Rhizobium lentis]MBX4977294.1 TIGR03885 family FMN-dependent LLM class oxidoreductase [Rhizobium lentis]MBX4989282.1 TIGR03885 family FMN-dependent LLM class oxidoreductase [Rhizobium lentis]MBX5001181.1 TIGR03885 family FMN-dependent LLM class oxidoreductase [Rhizobium lentis]MBX5007625.1 TIGR03885 family FMN-dependent LLM class oxidoreductase [Rhi